VAVRAWLRGDNFDLELLADLFPAGDPHVAVGTAGYYLTAAGFEDLFRDGNALFGAAEVALRRVNGAVRALNPEFRPVALVGRFTDETGHHNQVVLTDDHGRDQVVVAATMNGEERLSRPAVLRGEDYVALAASNPDVAEVLDVLGKPEPAPSWFDLYRVFEIVNGSVDIKRAGWVPGKRLGVFTQSANRRERPAADTRHPRATGGVEGDRMSLAEGRDLAGDFVTRWLDLLLQR
jgi:hypothetical protein